jgi:hypothetical protein
LLSNLYEGKVIPARDALKPNEEIKQENWFD